MIQNVLKIKKAYFINEMKENKVKIWQRKK